MTLNEFNSLSLTQASDLISQCCAAQRWVEKLVNTRPFSGRVEFFDSAHQIWLTMHEADYLEAFLAHPQIGDVNTLQKKFSNTKALASSEQGLVSQANAATIEKLAQANQDYLKKFGFIFIVCATGKSAAEMLNLLLARLDNSRKEELENAAAEQFKITQIRLNNLIEAD